MKRCLVVQGLTAGLATGAGCRGGGGCHRSRRWFGLVLVVGLVLGVLPVAPVGVEGKSQERIELEFVEGQSTSAVEGVLEEGGAQRVRVAASVSAAAPADVDVYVTVAASGSTASAGDYALDRTSMTVKIRAGREVGYSPVLTVTPVDDRRVEGDETIVFSGSTSAVGYSAIADASVSLNIVDDDDDAVVLSLDKPAVLEWDGGQTVEVTASFAGATGSDLTSASDVVVSVAGGSGGDGATAGSLGTGDFRRIWRVVRLR